jgi:hypothetical protein
MKKANRLFLKQRPKAKHILVEEVMLDGTLSNDCYVNTQKFANTNREYLHEVRLDGRRFFW